MTEWKAVSGYEGLYEVSSDGAVRSIPRLGSHGKELKQNKTRHGYLDVCLSKNNKKKRFKVHRLVALAFIANDLNKPEVNHKNGVKTDNRVCNLEWVTRSENERHAFKNGLKSSEICKTKKALEASNKAHRRLVVRSDGKEYASIEDAANDVRGDQSNISKVCSGKRKSAYGYGWSYKRKVLDRGQE